MHLHDNQLINQEPREQRGEEKGQVERRGEGGEKEGRRRGEGGEKEGRRRGEGGGRHTAAEVIANETIYTRTTSGRTSYVVRADCLRCASSVVYRAFVEI